MLIRSMPSPEQCHSEICSSDDSNYEGELVPTKKLPSLLKTDNQLVPNE